MHGVTYVPGSYRAQFPLCRGIVSNANEGDVIWKLEVRSQKLDNRNRMLDI